MAELGRGDLHPGGAAASATLVGWLAPSSPGRVLDVGAGAGLTSRRLLAAGWDVTALEPEPTLAARLRAVPGLQVREGRVEDLGADSFHAAVAESVLYGVDELPRALTALSRALLPGGLLALSEMVWRPGIPAATAEATWAESRRLYGIAGVSRAPWCWSDWRAMLVGNRHAFSHARRAMLAEAGFEFLRPERLGEGSPGRRTRGSVRATTAALVNRPSLGLDWARHRWRQRRAGLDNTHFESWLGLLRRGGP